MKKFGLLAITLFTLTFLGCGGNANQRAYERYQYDSARIEFIYPKEDTVVLEEEQESDWMDDGGGLIEIPDIPKERSINMNANNYEVERYIPFVNLYKPGFSNIILCFLSDIRKEVSRR